MSWSQRFVRLAALAGVLLGIVAIFVFVVRPWYLRWGATADEVRRPLPGDEIVANAGGQETRAITIQAPVDRVWPWVAQIGQDRGGFYSFDLLENLVGCEMPTVNRLRPDRQSWRVGDKLWMYPSGRVGGVGFATLRVLVPGRALAFGTHAIGTRPTAPDDGSWAFVLEPAGEGATRLLVRGRGAAGRSLMGVAFDRSIFEPVHFVMERRMMLGIAELAEGSTRGRLFNHLHVALWTLALAIFVIAVWRVAFGRGDLRRTASRGRHGRRGLPNPDASPALADCWGPVRRRRGRDRFRRGAPGLTATARRAIAGARLRSRPSPLSAAS